MSGIPNPLSPRRLFLNKPKVTQMPDADIRGPIERSVTTEDDRFVEPTPIIALARCVDQIIARLDAVEEDSEAACELIRIRLDDVVKSMGN